MAHVIRRLSLLLVSALLLGACAGSQQTSLSVGDESISRESLIDLFFAVNGAPAESAVVEANSLRDVASVWVDNAARTAALDEIGVSITEEERSAIDVQIAELIADQRVGELTDGSEAYEALHRNIWVNSTVDAEMPEVLARSKELMAQANVESRIGVINPELDRESPQGTPVVVGR